MKGGGARLNGEKIEDEELIVNAETFASKSEIKLSSGKKKHGIIIKQVAMESLTRRDF